MLLCPSPNWTEPSHARLAKPSPRSAGSASAWWFRNTTSRRRSPRSFASSSRAGPRPTRPRELCDGRLPGNRDEAVCTGGKTMFSRLHNLLRGCLLSSGVSHRSTPATVSPIITTPTVAARCEAEPRDGAEAQLMAWELDRANTLQDAEVNEQQALQHLTKAALLRLVVQFEDEGLFTVVHKLRTQIDALECKTDVQVPLTEP